MHFSDLIHSRRPKPSAEPEGLCFDRLYGLKPEYIRLKALFIEALQANDTDAQGKVRAALMNFAKNDADHPMPDYKDAGCCFEEFKKKAIADMKAARQCRH